MNHRPRVGETVVVDTDMLVLHTEREPLFLHPSCSISFLVGSGIMNSAVLPGLSLEATIEHGCSSVTAVESISLDRAGSCVACGVVVQTRTVTRSDVVWEAWGRSRKNG